MLENLYHIVIRVSKCYGKIPLTTPSKNEALPGDRSPSKAKHYSQITRLGFLGGSTRISHTRRNTING